MFLECVSLFAVKSFERLNEKELQVDGGLAALGGGGKTGIRTLGTRKGTTVFETVPIDHSGIFPFFWRWLCGRLSMAAPRWVCGCKVTKCFPVGKGLPGFFSFWGDVFMRFFADGFHARGGREGRWGG